jgi:hypothetical protein
VSRPEPLADPAGRAPGLDLGDPDGDTLEELTGLYKGFQTAAQAIEKLPRRGCRVDVEGCGAGGLVEVRARRPIRRPGDVAGLYATFETAADAVAELARQGLAVDVDVHHPTGRRSGPTIEVQPAGLIDEHEEAPA